MVQRGNGLATPSIIFDTEIETGKAKAMGIKFRAITLIVAAGVVTLSSVANAHHRHRAARGEHWYGIRWCTAPSPWGLNYYPCGPYRYDHRAPAARERIAAINCAGVLSAIAA